MRDEGQWPFEILALAVDFDIGARIDEGSSTTGALSKWASLAQIAHAPRAGTKTCSVAATVRGRGGLDLAGTT